MLNVRARRQAALGAWWLEWNCSGVINENVAGGSERYLYCVAYIYNPGIIGLGQTAKWPSFPIKVGKSNCHSSAPPSHTLFQMQCGKKIVFADTISVMYSIKNRFG